MEGFKQENSIVKVSIGKDFLGGYVKKREFKKPDEVNDAEERIKMKICEFELWSTMVFMR